MKTGARKHRDSYSRIITGLFAMLVGWLNDRCGPRLLLTLRLK